LLSDLRRGFLLRAGGYHLTALIFRELMTRHDARLSAMRAFAFSEMHDLAVHAGWENFQHEKFRSPPAGDLVGRMTQSRPFTILHSKP
jgi:hypothetical protein